VPDSWCWQQSPATQQREKHASIGHPWLLGAVRRHSRVPPVHRHSSCVPPVASIRFAGGCYITLSLCRHDRWHGPDAPLASAAIAPSHHPPPFSQSSWEWESFSRPPATSPPALEHRSPAVIASTIRRQVRPALHQRPTSAAHMPATTRRVLAPARNSGAGPQPMRSLRGLCEPLQHACRWPQVSAHQTARQSPQGIARGPWGNPARAALGDATTSRDPKTGSR
jgi:hypothetical protein